MAIFVLLSALKLEEHVCLICPDIGRFPLARRRPAGLDGGDGPGPWAAMRRARRLRRISAKVGRLPLFWRLHDRVDRFRGADHSHPISGKHRRMISFDEEYRYEQCSSRR